MTGKNKLATLPEKVSHQQMLFLILLIICPSVWYEFIKTGKTPSIFQVHIIPQTAFGARTMLISRS